MVSQVVIGPLNLVGGAFITQLSLLCFLFIAAFLLKDGRASMLCFILISTTSFLSLACLGMSDVFTTLWGPLLGSLSGWLKWQYAMIMFFLLNIFLSSCLVFVTGGGSLSPFQSLYFLIPTLAIFLREPAVWVVIYMLLVILSYTVSLAIEDKIDSKRFFSSASPQKLPTWIVCIACCLIAVAVGLATQAKSGN